MANAEQVENEIGNADENVLLRNLQAKVIEEICVKEEPRENDVCLTKESGNYFNNNSIDAVKKETTKYNGFIYCHSCNEKYDSFCLKCPMLVSIFDSPVQIESLTTILPNNLLTIKRSTRNISSVFTLKTIPKCTILGPYIRLETVEIRTGFAWILRDGNLKGNGQEDNWMRYINTARDVNEKNLTAFQCNGELYYESDRVISEGEELLMYYDDDVIECLDSQRYYQPIVRGEVRRSFACISCCLGFSSVEYLSQHRTWCVARRNEELLKDDLKSTDHKSLTIREKSLENDIDNNLIKSKRKCESGDAEDKKFKCSTCGYETNHSGSFTRHENGHVAGKSFKCDLCVKTFTQRASLRSHLLIHSGLKPYECSECQYKSNQKATLKRHIMRKHEREKRFSCDLCHFRCVVKAELKLHSMVHTGERPFTCEVCQKTFRRNSYLNMHKKVHFEGKRSCSACDYKTCSLTELKRHVGTRHPSALNLRNKKYRELSDDPNKVYACPTCKYQTNIVHHFKKHLKVHEGNRNFKCETCNKYFVDVCVLKTHTLIHKGEKQFKCDYCEYRCVQKGTLNKHVQNVHIVQKKYSCHMCPFQCALKIELLDHFKDHLGEQPFSCDICEKKFKNRANLTVHMNVHLDRKFNCSICKYETFYRGRLNEHVRKYHTASTKCHICEGCKVEFVNGETLEKHVSYCRGVKRGDVNKNDEK